MYSWWLIWLSGLPTWEYQNQWPKWATNLYRSLTLERPYTIVLSKSDSSRSTSRLTSGPSAACCTILHVCSHPLRSMNSKQTLPSFHWWMWTPLANGLQTTSFSSFCQESSYSIRWSSTSNLSKFQLYTHRRSRQSSLDYLTRTLQTDLLPLR